MLGRREYFVVVGLRRWNWGCRKSNWFRLTDRDGHVPDESGLALQHSTVLRAHHLETQQDSFVAGFEQPDDLAHSQQFSKAK